MTQAARLNTMLETLVCSHMLWTLKHGFETGSSDDCGLGNTSPILSFLICKMGSLSCLTGPASLQVLQTASAAVPERQLSSEKSIPS